MSGSWSTPGRMSRCGRGARLAGRDCARCKGPPSLGHHRRGLLLVLGVVLVLVLVWCWQGIYFCFGLEW